MFWVVRFLPLLPMWDKWFKLSGNSLVEWSCSFSFSFPFFFNWDGSGLHALGLAHLALWVRIINKWLRVRFLGHDICKQHSIELNAFCSSLRLEHLKVRYKQMLPYRVMIPVKLRGLWSLRSKPYGLAGTSVEDQCWLPHLNPPSERALPLSTIFSLFIL